MHGVVGMISEWNELVNATDSVNVNEEASDFMWYHALCFRVIHRAAVHGYGIDAPESEWDSVSSSIFVRDPDIFTISAHLFIGASSKLCDMAKRWEYYGDRPNVSDACKAINQMLAYALLLARSKAYPDPLKPLDQIRAINIAKLLKRYPNKFTEDCALIRNLGLERATMEAMA